MDAFPSLVGTGLPLNAAVLLDHAAELTDAGDRAAANGDLQHPMPNARLRIPPYARACPTYLLAGWSWSLPVLLCPCGMDVPP